METPFDCSAAAVSLTEGEPDAEHSASAVEEPVSAVAHNPCSSVSEHNETSDQRTSVSTEGPDSSEVTTPDSVDVAHGVKPDVGGPSANVETTVDATHLNAETAAPSLLSPVGSPVHVVRTLITQDDPLGVFTSTVTSTSSKTVTDPRTSRSSDDVVKSALMEEESVLMRRISEDAIGRTSWVAAATDSSLRKCSSLNRLSAESAHHNTSVLMSTAGTPLESGTRPSSASPRTSILGGTFRSAASRFATKYREIRESMVPPPQPPKVMPPGSGPEVLADVGGDATPTAVASDSVDSASPETEDATESSEGTEPVARTVPDSTVMSQSGKSRLRVPTALYSPLGNNIK